MTASGIAEESTPDAGKTGQPKTAQSDVIGRPDEPVRVISFASGGLDTAMQLGVIHALLVIQGKAPDAVVGVSAGAVNAVALAEILQAGHPGQTPQQQQQARVARFREILDAYQQAPGEILDSLLPDTFQIGAQRALQPLQLPIHDEVERRERRKAAEARSGLINLYNELMDLRLSFGTLTRGFRRFLGLKAAGNIRSRAGRWAARAVEWARTWFLLGTNLSRLAPLVPVFLAPLLRDKHRLDSGSTAGSIIFQSRPLGTLRRALSGSLSFLLLLGLWVSVTVVVLGAPFALVRLAGNLFTLLGWFTTKPWPDHTVAFLRTNTVPLTVAVYAVLIGVAMIFLSGRPWRELKDFNKTPGWKLFRVILVEATGGIATVVAVLMLVPLITVCLVLWSNGVPPARWTLSLILGQLPVILNPLWGVLTVWLFIVVVVVVWYRKSFRNYTQRLLTRYDIADSLLSAHPLRQFFIRLFDPRYYGDPANDDVVARALEERPPTTRECPPGKVVGGYARAEPPVHVGLTVADVATGGLQCVAPNIKVVDGLLAATAVTPFFPPQRLERRLYVDGANITREPTQSVLEMLRDRVHPDSTVAHIYAVSPLPFSKATLKARQTRGKKYLSLMEVALRALQLQRFRDATMERRMTELYTKTIPSGKVKFDVPGKDPNKPDQFVRAWIVPVEPEVPIELNRQLFRARDKSARRDLLAETVADGCRAALQVMIERPQVPGAKPQNASVGPIKCRIAVQHHLSRASVAPGKVLGPLPGSDSTGVGGPGLVQVCEHCALTRAFRDGKRETADEQTLNFAAWNSRGPAWPHRDEEWVDDGKDAHFDAPDPNEELTRTSAAVRVRDDGRNPDDHWPQNRGTQPGNERPLVSLLFSGGVFRGVYQVGVLNALSEAGVVPDIVAGASVGSITAAMVCQSLRTLPGPANETLEAKDARVRRQRQESIARLAGTYLALDQLVLTDRFADFIRNLTLRAAEARFSVNQADRMFRRFDSAGANRFSDEARLVTAGLERLFYISPFELLNLVEAFRDQNSAKVSQLLQQHLQEWLDRMGVGEQILGTEPLARLIIGHAMSEAEAQHAASVRFHTYLNDENPIFFLATVTNLTQGCLEILGLHYGAASQKQARLIDGLLASSAFPAVFRPRWSWEVMPIIDTPDQYIDGGTMDNLPLDAVAQFLYRASSLAIAKASRRPVNAQGDQVPHLLFSASLEVDPPRITDPQGLGKFENDWPALWGRARRLGYNRKLRIYEDTQRNLRRIYQRAGQLGQQNPNWTPLNLEVVVVRPQWLCSTFAFHPMLGFRRAKQAASIAHGCATTLVALARVGCKAETQPYLEEWGINDRVLPPVERLPDGKTMPLPPADLKPDSGRCWLRDVTCPFSIQALRELKLPRAMQEGVAEVYHACLDRKTHQPQ
jgi:predicted acylesterase/phospholipase RssA